MRKTAGNTEREHRQKERTRTGIKEAMRLLGRRRREAAHALGVSVATINGRLDGRSAFTISDLLTIAAWLDMSPLDLVRGEEHARAAVAWKLDQEARERKAIDRALSTTATA